MFQPNEVIDDSKTWFELANLMGVDIIDDNEEENMKEEQNEEDKEVQNIIKKGKETKRKMLRGMSNMLANI